MKTHRRFLVILLLFTLGVAVQQAVLPVLEGNDEELHFNYVNKLRNENRLPDRASFATNTTLQESGQPPLGYWVAAEALRLFNVPPRPEKLDLSHAINPWFTPPDPNNRRDNMNLYLHGIGESAFGYPEAVTADRVMRLASWLFGTLAVIGMYGASGEVFERGVWRLTATALFAFAPPLLYMSASVNNDVSATAFAALTIWFALRMVKRGTSWPLLGLTGLCLALGALSKVSALLIMPGVALAVVLADTQRRRNAGLILAHVALLLAVVALLFGPWMIYGWISLQDPFGFRTHLISSRIAFPIPSLSQLLGTLPGVYQSYWGKFGTSSVWFYPPIYLVFAGLVILALVGYGWYALSPHPLNPPLHSAERGRWRRLTPRSMQWRGAGGEVSQQAAVLITITAFVFLGLLYWLYSLYDVAFAITGRLTYTAHVPIMLAITGGLALLGQRLGHKGCVALRTSATALVAGIGLLAAPITIYSSYALPTLLTPEQLPALQGPVLDFGDAIRFLGYTQTSDVIEANSLHRVTLCWQVLHTTTHPAAFSIKLFSQTRSIVGDRTSIHGLGHFPASLWQPGDIFCDAVDVPISATLPDGQMFDVLLIMLNPQTSAVDWPAFSAADHTPLQYPFIGRVHSR